MSKAPHTPVDTLQHMSPARAAQVADVSRWTIMRAIKSHELLASRDNRNQWRITPDALEAWRAHTVRTPLNLHTPHTQEIIAELREKLAAETARADVAEAILAHERKALATIETDRDSWRAMAEKLADRPRRSWWPWSRS
ncbi:helix-turn-helix domain-containing protein [Paracoccus sp. R86501]|uniref:helix-turn-helix domain-containing protein n=1 Tax=Paracoccus sp. R86501 TaxID=3101711 RepID=UPI00366D5030